MWRLIKKHYRRKSIVVVHFVRFEQFFHLVREFLWSFSNKCGIGSISMQISSQIHNAANYTITKNSWQSYFKKFEVFFSRKQQGAIRTNWKIYSRIFNNLCIMVTIFQVANSLSIFQQQYLFGTIQKIGEK